MTLRESGCEVRGGWPTSQGTPFAVICPLPRSARSPLLYASLVADGCSIDSEVAKGNKDLGDVSKDTTLPSTASANERTGGSTSRGPCGSRAAGGCARAGATEGRGGSCTARGGSAAAAGNAGAAGRGLPGRGGGRSLPGRSGLGRRLPGGSRRRRRRLPSGGRLGGRLPSGSGFRGRGRLAVVEVPRAVDDTCAVGGEVGEQIRGQVESTPRAARALSIPGTRIWARAVLPL